MLPLAGDMYTKCASTDFAHTQMAVTCGKCVRGNHVKCIACHLYLDKNCPNTAYAVFLADLIKNYCTVYCRYCEQGGPLDVAKMAIHYNKSCTKAYKCAACEEFMSFRDVEAHDKMCINRIVPCPLQEFIAKFKIKVPVLSTRYVCQDKIQFGEMEQHKRQHDCGDLVDLLQSTMAAAITVATPPPSIAAAPKKRNRIEVESGTADDESVDSKDDRPEKNQCILTDFKSDFTAWLKAVKHLIISRRHYITTTSKPYWGCNSNVFKKWMETTDLISDKLLQEYRSHLLSTECKPPNDSTGSEMVKHLNGSLSQCFEDAGIIFKIYPGKSGVFLRQIR